MGSYYITDKNMHVVSYQHTEHSELIEESTEALHQHKQEHP